MDLFIEIIRVIVKNFNNNNAFDALLTQSYKPPRMGQPPVCLGIVVEILVFFDMFLYKFILS